MLYFLSSTHSLFSNKVSIFRQSRIWDVKVYFINNQYEGALLKGWAAQGNVLADGTSSSGWMELSNLLELETLIQNKVNFQLEIISA